MNLPKKKTLSLSKNAEPSRRRQDEENEAFDEDTFTIENIELALPCRNFLADYKVANSENFSPTLEFILRLVHSAPGIEREQVSAFFGYDPEETEFVISEATLRGYMSETDSRLKLTFAGHELFENSKDGPRLFTVRRKTDKVAFDLLSLAPTRQKYLDVRSLPELPISSEAASKGVAKEIQVSRLQRFFGELGLSKTREGEAQSKLYSVDNVRAESRFQDSIPVSLKVSVSAPSSVVVDLSEWRPDHEITDRMEIEREVSKFVDSMKTLSRSGDGDEAYDILSQLFPDYLDKFSTRKGLNVERFWREVSRQDPSPRKNRMTVPAVGSLFTQRNSKTLGEVIGYGLKNLGEASENAKINYLWLGPQIQTWAASSFARKTNELIRSKTEVTHADEDDVKDKHNLCVFSGSHPFHLRDVFDYVVDIKDQSFPKELELLYIPGVMVAASVHAPLLLNFGFPTPLGAMSFDAETLERTQSFVQSRLGYNDNEKIQTFLRNSKRICELLPKNRTLT